MKGADFRRARFRYVEFRNLDMLDVRWPEDEEHVVLDDYPAALDRVLAVLQTRSDVRSGELAAVLECYRKWVGSKQRQGVIELKLWVELVGQEMSRELLRIATGL